MIAFARAASAHAAYPEQGDPPDRASTRPGGLYRTRWRGRSAKALADRVQQPVVVDNIAGGGGNIGADKAAKSPADGYTLYIGNNATVGLNTLIYKQLPFDPHRGPGADRADRRKPDGAGRESVAAGEERRRADRARQVEAGAVEFRIDRHRRPEPPGRANCSTAATGVRMTHVPYKGTGPALTDLLGGQIQLMFNDTALPHDQVRQAAGAGRDRRETRGAQLPEVPDAARSWACPGYETLQLVRHTGAQPARRPLSSRGSTRSWSRSMKDPCDAGVDAEQRGAEALSAAARRNSRPTSGRTWRSGRAWSGSGHRARVNQAARRSEEMGRQGSKWRYDSSGHPGLRR